MCLITISLQDEGDQSLQVVEPVLPRQQKRKMSAYRQMKAAARAKKEDAKKRRGFVGVRNLIPDEEFQLMLQGTDSHVPGVHCIASYFETLNFCDFRGLT